MKTPLAMAMRMWEMNGGKSKNECALVNQRIPEALISYSLLA